ncbi:MAG: hypothetical protein ACI4F7_10525 [Acutalibacteraceae bacterium]
MTAGSSVVKLTAKTALKNNWLKCIFASLTPIFSFFVLFFSADYISYISNDAAAYVILALMLIFIFMPLLLGTVRFFWRMIFGAEDRQAALFYYFSDKQKYKRAVHMAAALVLRGIGFGIILFCPAIVVDIFSGVKFYDLINIPIPIWTGNLYYVSVFLKAAASVLLFFIMSKYYLAPFLIVADENMEIAEAVHMSCTVAKNTILDFISLLFSFLGWILISFFIFPLVFTMPYFITSLCVHVRFAVADYNKRIEKSAQNSFPTYAAGI